MDPSVEQSLERFLVHWKLKKVLPGQGPVLVWELPVLLEEAPQLGEVELSGGCL